MNATEAPPRAGATPPAPDARLLGVVMLARYHALNVDIDQLRHRFADTPGGGLSDIALIQAARETGLTVKTARSRADRLEKQPLPALALTAEGGAFIVARVAEGKALIQKLPGGVPESVSVDTLYASGWDGRLLLAASRASVLGELAKFDFTWFIPVVVRYRRLLGEVLLVSLVVQLLALFTPMLFQVVMDKVLVNNSFSTLQVVAAGLLSLAVFDALLTTLRSYVFAHTTSRMDVELGSRLFRHLLALPLAYFHARRVGDTVARVRELENIRSFLTGNALTLVLDAAFSVVFIAMMFYYSVPLALIVVASLPVYFVISLIFTPTLRRRLDEKFRRNAENQSLLVETVNGIDTVKSMAVEPQWTRKWDNQLADYVSSGMKTTTIGLLASGCVNFTGKLVNVLTLFFGAQLVIDGKLTVGQLIAFNMLAGQVANPIMRIAQLWNDFQQVGISVERLGDILNIRTEIAGTKSTMPAVKGAIKFESVVFRYKPDAPEVLHAVSLDIKAGEILGIVGRSGSGKSTLTKLVQRLYVPEKGRVLVDDIDLALVEASSLRRQIGVVLQENMLFNRSIRDNIALADPTAPLDRVVAMAKLAGAHEFITELPQGYDTPVGEHGTGLSGGQRQRIAIARALMTNPRILIFDEATSALDLESESIIQKNMKAICAGRTVLIIAHRLSAVRHAHRIVVVDKGKIIESGPHEQLLDMPGGVYATLHAMQLA